MEPPDRAWRIAGQAPLVWRSWDGESVVFHELSGDTQYLDVSASKVVRAVAERQPRQSELCVMLAEFLQVENDIELQKAVTQIVGKLDDLGIIEPVL